MFCTMCTYKNKVSSSTPRDDFLAISIQLFFCFLLRFMISFYLLTELLINALTDLFLGWSAKKTMRKQIDKKMQTISMSSMMIVKVALLITLI